MNENAKTKLVLEYTGMDDFSCPVYKDQIGRASCRERVFVPV